VSTFLPPVDQAALPADVRAAGPEARERYQAALAFERQLTHELAKQLTRTAERASGEEEGGSNPYEHLLPDALADAVTAAGGLGLARRLVDLDTDGASS